LSAPVIIRRTAVAASGPSAGCCIAARITSIRHKTILTIIQIETLKGCGLRKQFLEVQSLLAAQSAPGLALGREARQNQTDPVVMDAVDKILAAAKKAGLHAGMHCTSAEYAKEMIVKGFDFVTVISDENLLARGAAERAKLG
jgi:4-hydroxy-2-oxoheptanedioate aldolase